MDQWLWREAQHKQQIGTHIHERVPRSLIHRAADKYDDSDFIIFFLLLLFRLFAHRRQHFAAVTVLEHLPQGLYEYLIRLHIEIFYIFVLHSTTFDSI